MWVEGGTSRSGVCHAVGSCVGYLAAALNEGVVASLAGGHGRVTCQSPGSAAGYVPAC